MLMIYLRKTGQRILFRLKKKNKTKKKVVTNCRVKIYNELQLFLVASMIIINGYIWKVYQ